MSLVKAFKWSLLGLVGLALLIIALFAALVATKPGSGFLLNVVNSQLSARQTGVVLVSGEPRALIHGINLQSFSISRDDVEIDGKNLDIRLNILCRKATTICVELFSLDQLSVTTKGETQSTEPRTASLQLPEIKSPVPLIIDQIRLQKFDFGGADASPLLKDIRWHADGISLDQNVLTIEKSELGNSQWQHQLRGQLTLARDYPLQLDHAIAVALPGLPEKLVADFSLANSLANLQVNANIKQPQEVQLTATLQPLEINVPLQVLLEAARLDATKWSATAPVLKMLNLAADLEGDLKKVDFTLKANFSSDRTSPATTTPLLAIGSVVPGSVNIETLALGSDNNRLSMHGAVAWQPSLRGQLELGMQAFNPNNLLDTPLGKLNGQATVKFDLNPTQSQYKLDAALRDIQFNLDKVPYRINGSLSTDEQRFYLLQNIAVSTPKNSLQVNGKMAPVEGQPFASLDSGLAWLGRSTLRAQIVANDLAELHGELAGQLNAQIDMVAGQPITVRSSAQKLISPLLEAESLVLDGRLMTNLAAATSSTLSVLASNARTSGATWDSLKIDARGNYQNHTVSLAGASKVQNADARLEGRYLPANKSWHGSVRQLAASFTFRGLTSNVAAAQSFNIDWNTPAARLELAPFCLMVDSSKLCTAKSRYEGTTFVQDFSLQEFNFASLAPLLPEKLRWQGVLSGEGTLRSATASGTQVELALHGTPGFFSSNGTATPLRLDYEALHLELKSTAEKFSASFSLAAAGQDIAQGSLALSGQNFAALDGSLSIHQFPVGILAPLVPAAEILQAQLNIDMRVSGSVATPNLAGTVALDQGRFKLQRNASYLTDITLRGDFDNTVLTLVGDFRAGDGSGSVAGQVDFSEPVQGSLKLNGKKLQIDSRPLLNLWSDFDITANLLKNKLAIEGRVAIPEGKIEIKQLPRNAQSLSPDVSFTHTDGNQKPPRGPRLELSTKLDIALGPKLAFNGFNASANLDGRFRVSQSAGKPMQGSGEIKITDGKYRGYGQKLDVRRGRLLLNGPLGEPDIDIEAIRQVGTTTVGIKVSGEASEPQLTPFSEPPLPDDEIIFRIITGRQPGSKTTNSENQLIAQALVSGGLKFGGASLSDTAEKLGIQNFNVGTGDESDLLVSGNLDPSLYIEYGVNALGDGSSFKMRWDFARRLSLELIGGLQSSLDLLYSREF